MLTPAQLETSRTHPQSTELYLSVFQPRTVLSATVTGAVAIGSITIPYTTVSGSYLDVEAGMTILIGTTAGARDVGKLRVRSIDASNIVVAENSGITWTGKYLTVLRHFELWAVYPRIINDPANDENVIFYKDYDIVYSNQNSILGTFINAGPHRAGFVGDRFYYSASGTYNLVGSALTYDWAFEGGSVTGSSSADPGYVTYNTPGHYVTRLITTAANGAVDTTYRCVSIYNKPPNTTSLPIQKWSVDNLSGSRGEGGHSTAIKITDEVPPVVNDGDVVVLWSEDWYGNTKQSLGGNAENNSSIFYVGHIQNGSIRYNYKTSELDFQIASVTDIMKSTEGFAISVESKPSPAKWFEVLDLDGRRAIYHYLRWHSTALSVADFQFIGTDRKTQFFDSDRESVFDAVDNYMRTALMGGFVADRQGKMWAEVGAVAYTDPTGSFATIQTIEKRDWIGEPSITQQLTPTMSFVELGGVAYSGSTTGTFEAFLSQAPGTTPGYRGSTETIQGLTLESQAQLNQLSGNVLAKRNAKYPTVEFSLAGNFRQFDIAPLTAVDVNIASSDTNLGVAIHAPYLIDSLSWSYSSSSKIMMASMSLTALVNGGVGETVTIPDIPDAGGFSDFSGGSFHFNPGAFPPFLSGIANTNPLMGQWNGTTAVPSPILVQNWKPLSMDTQEFNYLNTWASGTFYPGQTGSGYDNPLIVPYTGIYLVQVNMSMSVTSNAAYYVGVGVGLTVAVGELQWGTIAYYAANNVNVAIEASKRLILTAGQLIVPKYSYSNISDGINPLGITTFLQYLRAYP
jgi:hypothetical protein